MSEEEMERLVSIILSRSCEYDLQAVLYLASTRRESPILQRTISNDLNIPNHFLGKVLQQLVRHGVVRSQKGKDGGFALERAPEEITLKDIVVIIDGKTGLDACLLGFPGCNDDHPCPVHADWMLSRASIIQILEQSTIADLLDSVDRQLDYIRSVIGLGDDAVTNLGVRIENV